MNNELSYPEQVKRVERFVRLCDIIACLFIIVLVVLWFSIWTCYFLRKDNSGEKLSPACREYEKAWSSDSPGWVSPED